MSDQPETIAAILAEMRAARNAESDMTLVPTEWLTQWADRIEAAAERERETADLRAIHRCHDCERENAAPGNAAAMREALKESTALLAVVRGDEYEENITRQIRRNADVLSAPARNCDRFATADDARRAFESAHSHGIVHNLYTAAFDWLFATAQEGGDHA